MAGLINWKKVAIPGGAPDSDHMYVGIDIADNLLYTKNSAGVVTKFPTTASVSAAIAAALVDYDLSTVVDSKIAAEVSSAINDLINGAGPALDTLNELAAALGNDPNFTTTITNALALKANTADLGDLALLDAVDSAQILDNAVTNTKIATNAVSVTKIANGAVNNTKLSDMPSLTIKGNDTGATADPKDLTATEAKTLLALENVNNTSDLNKPISTATQTALNLKYDASNPSNYQTAAQVTTTVNTASTADRARANHTGTQLSSTISDFSEAAQDAIGSAITAGSQDGIAVIYDDPTNRIDFTNIDKGSDAVLAHELASDPHPQYLTSAEGNAAYQPIDTDLTALAGLTTTGIITRTGAGTATTRTLTPGTGISITNGDGVSANPTITNSDTGSAAVTTHTAAVDPHPQYETSAEAQAKVDAHATLTNNPHAVTKAQVGLSNVDNTSDLSKPISTATQAALNLKYDASNPNNYETPAQLTTRDNANRDRANHTGTQLAATISNFGITVRGTILTGVTFATNAAILATDSILIAFGKLQAQITDTITNLSNHISNVSNPHATTKAQVGLGNVDDTSDLSKPISTATQAALDLKYDATNPSGYQTAAQVTTTVNAASTADRARANHTGTQLASTISDFSEAVDDRVGSLLVAGSNITLNYNDVANSLTINAATGTAAWGGITGTLSAQADLQAALNLKYDATNPSGYQTAAQVTSTVNSAVLGKANLSGGNTFSGSQIINGGLTLNSTTEGFLIPRMTSTQRLAIVSPATGLQVYDTDLGAECQYNGTWWTFTTCKIVANIQTSTVVTYANVTDLVTPSLEPGLYYLDFQGIYQSTVATTGIGFRFQNITAAVSTIAINWRFSQAANGTDKYFEYAQITLADNIASTATLTINTNTVSKGYGIFRITTAGTVTVQLRSEIAASSVSIRPDSILTIRKICD